MGPEVVYKSLTQISLQCPVVIIGQVNDYCDFSIGQFQVIQNISEVSSNSIYFYHTPPPHATVDPSYHYVDTAIQWALQKKVSAIVTAPVSKEKWLRSGVQYKGHTQLLAETSKVDQHCMFFWSKDLKTALFTVHIPLNQIFKHIKKEKIVSFIRFIDTQLQKLFHRPFHFLIDGLNPHAGESGFLGHEEEEEIIPAIKILEKEMSIEGPYPPDVIFIKAREIKDSVVISWYHDQGLIAFKLLNINSGVNMTLGLPYIRTSPDHGTAYDIAGKDLANPNSMKEAILLAQELVT